MWILESTGGTFQGRRLWLRPGKLYLLGRTKSEAGQLEVSHKTISRKHLTIKVDTVREGDAQNLVSRSRMTIEDLNSSKGSVVNETSIKGAQYEVAGDSVEFKMGKCPELFRITWLPVVLSFSFGQREMSNDPLTTLRAQLEQLDIKFLTDYNIGATTHVVSKKRNTSKGLQALINGRFIVSSSFTDAIVAAATIPVDADASPLETDFDGNWPNAIDHLPPRGAEAVERPPSFYAPDPARLEIFDGYTFVFYDKTQYDTLLAPITNGKGKALLQNVVPGETEVDDFVRYVKSVAGEKGHGSFEDGSEGKGVVVVRYLPAKGEHVPWFAEFTTAVSLRLDHRTVEQGEFLDAILTVNASALRRPLPVEPGSLQEDVARSGPATAANTGEAAEASTGNGPQEMPQDSAPQQRRMRVRRPATKRFKGFDDDDDGDDDGSNSAPASAIQEGHSQDAMFVAEGSAPPASQEAAPATRRSTRKRVASPIPEEDNVMDDIAPTAAAVKRRRIERGEEPVPREPTPDVSKQSETSVNKMARGKKARKEIDVLEAARKAREEAEARDLAEKEELANLPEDIDLAEVRRLAIVEEMEVRRPVEARARAQDTRDSRWDPKWDGRKNFKRFRPRGEPASRVSHRASIPLTQAKTKEFGIGDDYWLEDDSSNRTKGSSLRETQSQPKPPEPPRRSRQVVSSDSEDEADELANSTHDTGAGITFTRSTRASQRTADSQPVSSRSQTQRRTQGKRPASPPLAEPTPKRQRPTTRRAPLAQDSESEGEGLFRFGRRR